MNESDTAASLVGDAQESPPATAVARTVLTLFAAGIPLDVLPLSATASATFAAGGVLVLAGGWQILRCGRVRPVSSTILLLTALTAWSAASLLWAPDQEASVRRLLSNVALLAFVWTAWQIARSWRDVRSMAAGYVAGCVVAAAGAWQSFLSGVTHTEMGPQQVPDFEDPRYVAAGFDPNDMGVTLAIGIPIAVSLAVSAEGARGRIWLAYLPLALSAIALSGSRGATLTAAVAIAMVLFWIGPRSRGRMVVVTIALLLAGGGIAWLLAPETVGRIFTIRQQLAGGTLGERTPIWRAALTIIERHPLAGVGIGGFGYAVAPILGSRAVAHNAFLSIAAELGGIGLFLFVAAVVSVVRAARRSTPRDRALVRALVLTWFVGVASLTWEFRKATWFVLLLGAAVGALRPGQERETPA